MAVVSGVISMAIAEPDRCKATSPRRLVNQSRTVSLLRLFVFFTRSPRCAFPRATAQEITLAQGGKGNYSAALMPNVRAPTR